MIFGPSAAGQTKSDVAEGGKAAARPLLYPMPSVDWSWSSMRFHDSGRGTKVLSSRDLLPSGDVRSAGRGAILFEAACRGWISIVDA
jgi:hypothetical protein